MNRDDAIALMHEYTESDALRKHMYAVEAAMRAGQGNVTVYPLDARRQTGPPWHQSGAPSTSDLSARFGLR